MKATHAHSIYLSTTITFYRDKYIVIFGGYDLEDTAVLKIPLGLEVQSTFRWKRNLNIFCKRVINWISAVCLKGNGSLLVLMWGHFSYNT